MRSTLSQNDADSTVASQQNVRSHLGHEFDIYQTARPVPLPASPIHVPVHRQLATIQNADQARLIRSLNLCRETDRYQTFNSDWPLDSAPSGREMAASGWFYLGNLDRTQCFSCGGVLRNWRRLDYPNTEHISHFPHCSMAQGRESQNIPDTGRRVLYPITNGSNQLTNQQKANLKIMFPCEFPVTHNMKSVRDRVNTFTNWYFTRTAPETIAEAGMFALGVRDRVKCFYCNGGLQNWRQGDNPWEEHAKWYPTCEFLLQQRGPEYIHTIVTRFPNINRPILRAPGQDVPPSSLDSSRPGNSRPSLPNATGHEVEMQVIQGQDQLAAAMKTEVACTVVGMGFDASLVRDVMRAKIEQHGMGFVSAVALLEAVQVKQSDLDKEEEEKRKSSKSEMDSKLSDSILIVDEDMSDEEMQPGCCGSATNTKNVAAPATRSAVLSASSGPTSNIPAPASLETSADEEKLKLKLERELQELEDQLRCKVCLDNNADMVFMPCGHICCCMECTRALRICPICRVKIEKAVRTYTS